ncbi:MAG: 3-phosphoshikimate 1-carboxyvinyltransferase [Elusimicrobia bacterium CG_4_10_14_0_8_um_filter_37_32]|nr:MAG: 3-phosphoshikimate 1-carboxyvinyltransferase [Elusimicrobia bacterium CG02_land_8_20_14_3_00_37_13]PIZ12770.1 MAG: 3-phosphoshikimate 1-carboxyvinyltransferase [Elusimicrobia bacterium CG_4_10_14_0_8_um_filter_37_32]
MKKRKRRRKQRVLTNYNLSVSKVSYLKGEITAPPSKSYTHRAIIIGSMNGGTRIVNPLFSDDTEATIKAWRSLGATIRRYADHLDIIGFNRKPSIHRGSINVNESGTLLRFILTVIPCGNGKFTITGNGTLKNRPNTALVEALKSMGVEISGTTNDHKLPITITARGELSGGNIEVNGKMSSQAISSLLIGASLAKNDTVITVKNTLVSKPYVDITIDVLNWAGVKVENDNYQTFRIKAGQNICSKPEFIVHGDYSSAAFIIVACCLIKSNVVIKDLIIDKQGDRKIIDILNTMGASIEHMENEVRIKGPYKLKGIEIDCCDIPDLVPILVVLGAFAEGTTRIYNISHLVHKESNRVYSTADELMRIGGNIQITNNEIKIIKSKLSAEEMLSAHDDHRVAMALSVSGMKIGGLTIENGSCITKSYPNFVSDMRRLGAKISRISPGRKRFCFQKNKRAMGIGPT